MSFNYNSLPKKRKKKAGPKVYGNVGPAGTSGYGNVGPAPSLGALLSPGGDLSTQAGIKAALGRTMEPHAKHSEETRLALRAANGDYGAERAERAYKAIMKSSLPDDVKADATEKFKLQGGDPGDSGGGWADNPLFNAVGGAVQKLGMVLEKPIRATAATLEEILEETNVLEEDDKSWFDNFAREGVYGHGNVLQRFKDKNIKEIIDNDPNLEHGNEADEKEAESRVSGILGSPWGMRGVGLAGDILLDPLTYVGVGAVTKTGKGATRLSKALSGAEGGGDAAGAAKAILSVPGDTSGQAHIARQLALTGEDIQAPLRRALGRAAGTKRVGTKLNASAVARRADQAGAEELAARVLDEGTGALTKAQLDALGLRGGLRVGIGNKSATLVPHDVWRHVTGPIGKAIKGPTVDNRLARGLQSVVGDSTIAGSRIAKRNRKLVPRERLDALGTIDTARASKLASKRFGGRLSKDLMNILDYGKAKKVDGEDIRASVSGSPEAKARIRLQLGKKRGDKFVKAIEKWVGKVRSEANMLSPDEFIAFADGGYMPRFLTEEARAIVEKRMQKSHMRSFEKRATREGDEFGEHKIGDDELVERFVADGVDPASRLGVEQQMEGLIKEWGGPDQIFSRNAYEDLPRHLRAVQSRVHERSFLQEAQKRGLLRADESVIEGRMNAAQADADRHAAGPMAKARAGRQAADEKLNAALLDEDFVAKLLSDTGPARQKLRSDVGTQRSLLPGAVPEDRIGYEQAREIAQRVMEDKNPRAGRLTKAEQDYERLAEYIVDLDTRAMRRGKKLKPKEAEALAEAWDKVPGYEQAAKKSRKAVYDEIRHTQKRVDQAMIDLANAQANNSEYAEDLGNILFYEQENLRLLKQIDQESDKALKQVLQLEAAANKAEAKFLRRAEEGMAYDELAASLRDPDVAQFASDQIEAGMKNMHAQGLEDMVLSKHSVEAMERLMEVKEKPQLLGRYMDSVNKFFKSYATLSLGFHFRNSVGATMMNFVAGVSPRSYGTVGRNLAKWRRAVQAGKSFDEALAAVDPKFRPFMQELEESGGVLWDNAQFIEELGEGGGADKWLARGIGGDRGVDNLGRPVKGHGRGIGNAARVPKELGGKHTKLPQNLEQLLGSVNRNVGITENLPVNFSRALGDRTEKFQRTVLAYDTWSKGGTMDEALDKISTYHFDYSDLSDGERKYVKRVVPFWTFMSRNLPMQLEQMVRNPKVYSYARSIKRNLELGNDNPDELTPSWMKEGPTAIHMGNNEFLTLDMPISAADETLRGLKEGGPLSLVSSMAPTIKAPLEMKFGKQSFTGIPISDQYAEVPPAMQALPGLVPLLEANGRIKISTDGKVMMSGEDSYMLEQAWPLLGRARRLFPADSDKRGQEKRMSAILSFMGIGWRSATESDFVSTSHSIADELEAIKKHGLRTGHVERSFSLDHPEEGYG